MAYVTTTHVWEEPGEFLREISVSGVVTFNAEGAGHVSGLRVVTADDYERPVALPSGVERECCEVLIEAALERRRVAGRAA